MLDTPHLNVVVDDDTETVRVDPLTGTVETDQPDGGVVVQLDAQKPKNEDEEDAWFANLADKMDAAKLGILANDLYDQVSADDRSRQQKIDDITRGLDLLGIQIKEPRALASDGAAVDGMSTVTNPLLLEAVLKGWANAQAELLPAAGPVKIRDDGDETAAEDDLADAFERDMNHWFTTTAAEYYPDTSHMLLWGVYFGGCGIKKVYRCPMRRRPTSESVAIKDFIVSDATKDLRACGRITHQIEMRPSVMKRMMLIGAYRDVTLTQPTPTTNAVDEKVGAIQGTTPSKTRPEDQPHNLWETQCELDLDEFIPADSKFKGEGIPLPYLVTMDKDSREILAIRRDWDEDDAECERKRMYVKYPYVPGPGFYGTGMLNILGNSSSAMTAAWRLSLDSAMFANFPAGFIAKGTNRQNSSIFTLGPAQWQPIDTGNMPIGQVILPNPYKDVTAGMMALMKEITGQSKEVGGTADIPAGEGLQNVPVGTMLANIEQATKVMAAAHKGMHTAQALEFELIIDLFRANPEDFWRSNKVCPKGYWNEERFNQAVENLNLVPVSDPNVPSHIHRVAKALGLLELYKIFPTRMDPEEVLKRSLRALREDPNGLVVQPPADAGQDTEGAAKMVLAKAKDKEADVKGQKVQIEAATGADTNRIKEAEISGKLEIAKTDLQKELIIHAHDGERAAAQHGLAERAQVHDEVASARSHDHEVEQHQHTKALDVAQHALDVHTALNPPKPAKPKPKAKK